MAMALTLRRALRARRVVLVLSSMMLLCIGCCEESAHERNW